MKRALLLALVLASLWFAWHHPLIALALVFCVATIVLCVGAAVVGFGLGQRYEQELQRRLSKPVIVKVSSDVRPFVAGVEQASRALDALADKMRGN